MHVSGIPGDPEHNLSLRLTELLQNGDELRTLLEDRLQGGDHLIHSLQKLLLVWVPGLHLVEDSLAQHKCSGDLIAEKARKLECRAS